MRWSKCSVFLLTVLLQSVFGWNIQYHSGQYEGGDSDKEHNFGHGYHHIQHNERYPYNYFNHGHYSQGHYPHGYYPHSHYSHGHYPYHHYSHGHYPHQHDQNHEQGHEHGAAYKPHQNGQYDNEKDKHDFNSGHYPQKNEHNHKQGEKHEFEFGYYPQFGEQHHKQGEHYNHPSHQQKENEKHPTLNKKNDTNFGQYPQYDVNNHKNEEKYNFSGEPQYPDQEEGYEPNAGQSPQNNEQVTTQPEEDDVTLDTQTELNRVGADNNVNVTSPVAVLTPEPENDNEFTNEEGDTNRERQTETSTEAPAEIPIQTEEVPKTNDIQTCISSCPVTSEYNPLCGTNNVTYTNPSSLECAKACGENTNFLRFGACRAALPVTSITLPTVSDEEVIDLRPSPQ